MLDLQTSVMLDLQAYVMRACVMLDLTDMCHAKSTGIHHVRYANPAKVNHDHFSLIFVKTYIRFKFAVLDRFYIYVISQCNYARIQALLELIWLFKA